MWCWVSTCISLTCCGTNLPNSLRYDVVMKLCERINGQYHHDNLFTSVSLLLDLLWQRTYACNTVKINKRRLPIAVKCPEKLVATIWQDNKHVQVHSMNSDQQMHCRQIVNYVQNCSGITWKVYLSTINIWVELITIEFCLQYDFGWSSKKKHGSA